MAEPQLRWADDRFGAYLRRWAPEEVLVSESHLGDVIKAAKEVSGVVLEPGEARNGIVRAAVKGADEDTVGRVVNEVRDFLTIKDLSPVHRTMIGQPNVVGNPDDVLPKSATSGFATNGVTDGVGVTIAFVDTGLEPHPWLEGRQYKAWPSDYEWQVMVRYGDRDVLGPQAGHCVFLAGLALEQAPGATILAIKTADSFGISDIDDVAAAILRAARRGAHVINLSLGCTTREGKEPWTLRKALNALSRMEAPPAVVAAAGNSNGDEKFWPAASDDVTAVGAVESHDGWTLARYTNCGSWVDVYVPGTDVLSTYIQYSGLAIVPNGDRSAFFDKYVDYRTGWATWTGTSMASAVWSGVVARAISRAREGGSDASPAEIARALPGRPSDVGLPELTLVEDDQMDAEGRPRRAYGVEPGGPGTHGDYR
jgi:subtilisin family serine protease